MVTLLGKVAPDPNPEAPRDPRLAIGLSNEPGNTTRVSVNKFGFIKIIHFYGEQVSSPAGEDVLPALLTVLPITIKYIFRAFVFEVWCERSRLLGPMDMFEAIASFLHLAFVFNLKYPKVFCIYARGNV